MKAKGQFWAAGLLVAVMAVSSAGAGGRQQFPFAGGRVTAVDQKTITVEGFNGSRKINVTDKTQFTKSVEGKLSDIKKGVKVAVRGTMSADGKTIEAARIVVNPPPMMRGGNRRGGAPSAPAPASPGARPGGGPPGGRGGGFGGFTPPTRGEVTRVAPLTVKTEDGQSVT
ncbi:MAG: DUF5666 domain-containing protein, partial [Abditibacteriales bacterium]|nr:DUF5666 domain-containing protein [Abditibacteriales bacterium]